MRCGAPDQRFTEVYFASLLMDLKVSKHSVYDNNVSIKKMS